MATVAAATTTNGDGGGDSSGRGGDDGDDDEDEDGGGDRGGAPCRSVAYTVRVSACVRARARLVGGSRCCIQDEVRLETFVDSSGGKGEPLHVSSGRPGRGWDRAACPSETSAITRAEERAGMSRAPYICRCRRRRRRGTPREKSSERASERE